jgi:hypothetical protein
MAIGYERLNSSAARSKRRSRRSSGGGLCDGVVVTKAGEEMWDPIYGYGKTTEEFVSDCDSVKCEFESGYVVTMRGGAVRECIASREKKNEQ